MLLVYPPIAKPCEPPAGIALLAGALRYCGVTCALLDASLEGFFFLLGMTAKADDTWSKRCYRHINSNLTELRTTQLYKNRDRYQRAVADINHLVELAGGRDLLLSLANYQDRSLSALRSEDLLRAAERFEENIFFPYFSLRLPQLVEEKVPVAVGFSLNYLSQAPSTFAMIGFLKKRYPQIPVILGGGLVTSWMRNPGWQNPFVGLVDQMIAGPGEKPLGNFLGVEWQDHHFAPDYSGLPVGDYLSPGFVLPYAASSGCYWNKCSFCPEKAEENPYHPLEPSHVLADLARLTKQYNPSMLHFLDNAISPALLRSLVENPPHVSWYGFARISPLLADHDFCRNLRDSGCVMLKLGLESGDQNVLDSMDKGIDLEMASKVMIALQSAGIATYVYLLFGTPSESLPEARRTLDFVVRHHAAITFLNLAVFNMPVCGPDAAALATSDFYEGDLSLYTDFQHPKGWGRKEVRRFLDREFKRHPAVAEILRRDPPHFTSNHAPFFVDR
ncbi:MAG: radical SAM protein [Desulfobulbaceae bacterium]|nr:radical SAM protein [Desulfobulbaceae bacterium]